MENLEIDKLIYTVAHQTDITQIKYRQFRKRTSVK